MDDYSKKTRSELIAICKERSIKGVSSKKKAEIIQLLVPMKFLKLGWMVGHYFLLE